MERNRNFLAAHGQPGGELTEYSPEQLRDPRCVEELFDYCQILQGVITAAGWEYLLRVHGLSSLLEIDRRSGWLDAEDSAAADALKYQCLIAGYDPQRDCCGSYDEASGVFTAQDGNAHVIEWGRPWVPAASTRREDLG